MCYLSNDFVRLMRKFFDYDELIYHTVLKSTRYVIKHSKLKQQIHKIFLILTFSLWMLKWCREYVLFLHEYLYGHLFTCHLSSCYVNFLYEKRGFVTSIRQVYYLSYITQRSIHYTTWAMCFSDKWLLFQYLSYMSLIVCV